MPTMTVTYAVLVAAIFFEVIGTTLLKQAEQFTKLWPTVFSMAAYGVAFYLLSIVLKTMPVGIAYAIWSGLGIVFVSIIGVTVFRQSLDWPAIAGLLLIIIGIVIVNLFSSSVGH
ncbi:DMT family transporter [Rhizobium sp. C4]|uniref:DMT family transporter n=1 Tax=Rhizobium sp. C4 TaxID=1349800 RepID=UPI001E60407A|nr:multidrug efflux SMR transporter [Rhizobium sp. C4]MCD2173259.1 multidrug efflux SMR transporter [Rhizobium sp. C4]